MEDNNMNKCVVFDLDGTLGDTIKDIANSVNLTRREYKIEPLSIDTIIGYTGDGARKLLERSFADHPVDIDEALKKMVQHYYDCPVVYTKLYPGVANGLAKLKSEGWKLAVVTNKPGIVAREILKTLDILQYFDDLIGGGDGFPLKPDPAVMFHLMKKYGVSPDHAWVLGDNHTDMDSAANAGMSGAFASWGFGFLNGSECTVKVASFMEFINLLTEKK